MTTTGNIDAEKIILANLIDDTSLIYYLSEDGTNLFQYQEHKKLYNSIKGLIDENKDINPLSIQNKDSTISLTVLNEVISTIYTEQFDAALTIAKEELTKLRLLEFKNKINAESKLEDIADYANNLLNKNIKTSIESSHDILNDMMTEVEKNYINGISNVSTGFPCLDKKIGGGLYNGLYVIGAGSSIGKTTFVQQISDFISSTGKKVLFFSLEMGKKEMLSKSLVRELYKNNKSRWNTGSREFLNGSFSKEEVAILKGDYDTITKSLSNVFYVEGNFNTTVKEIVNQANFFKAKYKEAPVIIVDYLQVIAPSNAKFTDKQNVDFNIAELKRLSRNLDTTVIAISSVNRQNYLSYIDFSSFKESGSVEYSADVVIGLQLNAIHQIAHMPDSKVSDKREIYNKAKDENPREIELVVLKNRYGRATGTHNYTYNAKFNLFHELEYTNKVCDTRNDSIYEVAASIFNK